MEGSKAIHVKPSLYANYFFRLKELAMEYGYNLVLHGSLHRDLDLIAVPWRKELKPHTELIEEFAKILGGYILTYDSEGKELYKETHHGRMHYVINIKRGGDTEAGDYYDFQYYLDISVIPAITNV